MNILIIGDSWAADWSQKHSQYPGWPNILAEEFNVTNIAQAGVSQYSITQQLKKTPSTTQDADDYISNYLCNYNPTYQHNNTVDPTSLAVSSRPMSVFFYNNVAFLYTNSTISENSTLSFTFNEEIDDYINNVQPIDNGWIKDTLNNYHLLLKRNTNTIITKKKWKPLFSLKQEETKKR